MTAHREQALSALQAPPGCEVAVIGAGPAGLSAALVLSRAGRHVVVIDAGQGRNAPATHAYGLFTRDGTPPGELRSIGRGQAERYGAIFLEGTVDHVDPVEGSFTLRLADGSSLVARKLLLAIGVEDLLPDLPGVREAWGRTAVHCPYCHGYELRGMPTAFLGRATGSSRSRMPRAASSSRCAGGGVRVGGKAADEGALPPASPAPARHPG